MGYPVYKLIRAVNRQYPNNGFIDYVDVTEGTDNEVVDEDLRDLINEAIQETYIDIARDEVYSFPTVPGQNQYVLPDDCELRDIQEVTRTFRGPGPFPPPPMPPEPEPVDPVRIIFDANGGTGEMPDMIVSAGDTIVLPFCDFIAPAGKEFHYWEDEDGNHYNPGDEFTTWSIGNVREYTFKAIWNVDPQPVWEYEVTFTTNPLKGLIDGTATEKSYTVLSGQTVPEVPTIVEQPGEEFIGWLDPDGVVTTTQRILDTVVEENMTYTAYYNVDPEPVWEYDVTVQNVTPADLPMTLYFTPVLEAEESVTLAGNGGSYTFYVEGGEMLADRYSSVYIIDYYGETRTVPTDVIITQDTLYEYTQFTDPGRDPEEDENPLGGD